MISKSLLLKLGIGTASLLGGAGITSAIVVPMALEAKNGLSNFVPNGGIAPMKSWNIDKKINYVALGDSETSGYNGFSKADVNGNKDKLSYADFFAQDLKNASHLNQYHNFAVSGATFADQQKLFAENVDVLNRVKEADLITVTIGANDLLSFLKIIHLPFITDIKKLFNKLINDKVNVKNKTRESIFGEKANIGYTLEESNKMLLDTMDTLKEMADSKDFSKILGLDENVKDVIFDLLYRNMLLFIHDLHLVAPKAQIIVLGHVMPFAQWPKKVLEKHRDDLGMSILTFYSKMISAMRRGATFALSGSNKYTLFYQVDKLKIHKSSDSANDGKNKIFDDYIKYDQAKKDFAIKNAMPNAMDIHPSQFGHELIGNALFSNIFPYLHIKNQKPESFYQLSHNFDDKKPNDLWQRVDEDPNVIPTNTQMLSDLLNNQGLIFNIVNLFKDQLANLKNWQPLLTFLKSSAGNKVLDMIFQLFTSGSKQSDSLYNDFAKCVKDNKVDIQAMLNKIETWKSDEKNNTITLLVHWILNGLVHKSLFVHSVLDILIGLINSGKGLDNIGNIWIKIGGSEQLTASETKWVNDYSADIKSSFDLNYYKDKIHWQNETKELFTILFTLMPQEEKAKYENKLNDSLKGSIKLLKEKMLVFVNPMKTIIPKINDLLGFNVTRDSDSDEDFKNYFNGAPQSVKTKRDEAKASIDKLNTLTDYDAVKAETNNLKTKLIDLMKELQKQTPSPSQLLIELNKVLLGTNGMSITNALMLIDLDKTMNMLNHQHFIDSYQAFDKWEKALIAVNYDNDKVTNKTLSQDALTKIKQVFSELDKSPFFDQAKTKGEYTDAIHQLDVSLKTFNSLGDKFFALINGAIEHIFIDTTKTSSSSLFSKQKINDAQVKIILGKMNDFKYTNFLISIIQLFIQMISKK